MVHIRRFYGGKMKEIRTGRLTIVPFELKYLNDYYNGFDKEITKYQYPDSFDSVEAARTLLQEFIDDMNRGEMLFLPYLTRRGHLLAAWRYTDLQKNILSWESG